MTASSKTRVFVCALVALALCAPILANPAPTADRPSAATFRALAPPSSTLLFHRDGAGHDHARQRPATPTVFTLIPIHADASDPGAVATAVESPLPCSLWTSGPPTGRGPPAIS